MTPQILIRGAAVSARQAVAAPGGLGVAVGFYLMVTAVLAGLWSAAADGSGGEIVGYTATALIWYIATSESAVSSIPIRMIEDIGDAITSRRVELEMLRPTSVVAFRIASEFGTVLPRLGATVVVGLGFALIVGGAPPSLTALALAAPSLVLAVLVNLALQHSFAAGAFWVQEAKSAWFLYQKLVFVVGGMLLPLEVLPGPLEIGAKFLPFAAVAYAPARLASGHVEPGWLVVQLGWLLIVGFAAVRVFAAGERELIRAGE